MLVEGIPMDFISSNKSQMIGAMLLASLGVTGCADAVVVQPHRLDRDSALADDVRTPAALSAEADFAGLVGQGGVAALEGRPAVGGVS
jgi:hypothetical protein